MNDKKKKGAKKREQKRKNRQTETWNKNDDSMIKGQITQTTGLTF